MIGAAPQEGAASADSLKLFIDLAERDDVSLVLFVVTAILVVVQVTSSVLSISVRVVLTRIEARYTR